LYHLGSNNDKFGLWGPIMTHKELERFFVPRSEVDRRGGPSGPAPYFTEEGMVMIDRRESEDRRKAKPGAMNTGTAGQTDLYLISRLV
jgi:hypothetical protein